MHEKNVPYKTRSSSEFTFQIFRSNERSILKRCCDQDRICLGQIQEIRRCNRQVER